MRLLAFLFAALLPLPAIAQSLPAPQVVTQAANDNSSKAASTAFVKNALGSYAPLSSPIFTGAPIAPTQSYTDISTKLATTAFVDGAVRVGLSEFTKFLAYGTAYTPIISFGRNGTAGIAAGVRTSDLVNPFNDGLASVSWAFQDDSVGRGAWAQYTETRKFTTGSGYAHGQEIEISNLSGIPSIPPDPYSYAPAGAAFGQLIGSGGQCGMISCPDYGGTNRTPSAATSPITIVGNTARFQRGINFAFDSLIGTDGADADTGVAHALNLARGQMIDWYSRSGGGSVAGAFQMGSLITSAGTPLRLIATDSGLEVQNFTNGVDGFRVAVPANVANGVVVSSATSGNGVSVGANGSDANVNMTLQGKGAGWVFINNSAGYFALSPTGKLNEPTFTPASSSDTCTTGDRAWDASYEYRCVATNTWKRSALSTF